MAFQSPSPAHSAFDSDFIGGLNPLYVPEVIPIRASIVALNSGMGQITCCANKALTLCIYPGQVEF